MGRKAGQDKFGVKTTIFHIIGSFLDSLAVSLLRTGSGVWVWEGGLHPAAFFQPWGGLGGPQCEAGLHTEAGMALGARARTRGAWRWAVRCGVPQGALRRPGRGGEGLDLLRHDEGVLPRAGPWPKGRAGGQGRGSEDTLETTHLWECLTSGCCHFRFHVLLFFGIW